MATDDLSPYLNRANPGKPLTYRQGTVVFWDPVTAENIIQVGNELFTDVPILNTNEAAILAAGDIVGIMVAGATWGILGRFTVPGTAAAVSALSSLRTAADSVTGLDSFTGTSFVAASTFPGPEVTISVGASGRLLIFLSADISGQGSAAANNTVQPGGMMGFVLSGANTLAASSARAYRVTGNALTNSSAITYGATGAGTRAVLLDGLTPGSTTVTAQYAKIGTATQANITNRNIAVMAL
jgi:hypothetical protein